jgi:hypothetical protein
MAALVLGLDCYAVRRDYFLFVLREEAAERSRALRLHLANHRHGRDGLFGVVLQIYHGARACAAVDLMIQSSGWVLQPVAGVEERNW